MILVKLDVFWYFLWCSETTLSWEFTYCQLVSSVYDARTGCSKHRGTVGIYCWKEEVFSGLERGEPIGICWLREEPGNVTRDKKPKRTLTEEAEWPSKRPPEKSLWRELREIKGCGVLHNVALTIRSFFSALMFHSNTFQSTASTHYSMVQST